MKKHRSRILAVLIVLAVLAAAFWWGGSAPGLRGLPDTKTASDAAQVGSDPGTAQSNQTQTGSASGAAAGIVGDAQDETEPGPNPASVSQTRTEPTEPSDSAAQETADPGTASGGQTSETETEENLCTLSVRCDTILDHMDWLDPAKRDLVPGDGVLFPATQVRFYDGESVFNVLQRALKQAGVQMEFVNVPLYGSAYLEGIGNLYEFDCGERSGWMYRVNGVFPGYGCSLYLLQPGDGIEWVYTCDLGADVGGGVSQTGSAQSGEGTG